MFRMPVCHKRLLLPATTVLCLAAGQSFSHHVPSKMKLGTNLWNIGWGAANLSPSLVSPAYNYFRDVDTWATVTDPWRKEFLDEMRQAKYTTIRFMDWSLTNSVCVTDWSQRIPPTVNHISWGWPEKPPYAKLCDEYGVAYEWQIDLCNRLNVDYWLCTPAKATTQYNTEYAKLVKSKLNPNLKIYVEYSNEVWNYSFPQIHYAISVQAAKNLPMPTSHHGSKLYPQPAWAGYAYLAVRAWEPFLDVFGADSNRIIKVLAGQLDWTGGASGAEQADMHLACLENPVYNPRGLKADAYALAPYIKGGSPSGDMRTNLNTALNQIRTNRRVVNKDGIPLILYEGGADNFANQSVATDPGQEQLYYDMYDSISTLIEGVWCHYTHIGGCWGLKDKTADPESSSPKWRGYMRWLKDHPEFAVGVQRTDHAVARGGNGVADLHRARFYSLDGRRMGSLKTATTGLRVMSPGTTARALRPVRAGRAGWPGGRRRSP